MAALKTACSSAICTRYVRATNCAKVWWPYQRSVAAGVSSLSSPHVANRSQPYKYKNTRLYSTEVTPATTAAAGAEDDLVSLLSSAEVPLVKASSPKRTSKLLDVAGQMAWLNRIITKDTIEKVVQNPSAWHRLSLEGSPGTGKTIGMIQMLMGCRNAGWIVAHVPKASEWSHEQQSIEANKRNDHLLDQYAASADWLAHFLLWNAGTLKSLPLTIEYAWDEATEGRQAETPQNVQQLAQLGVNEPIVAMDVVSVLLQELANPALEVPVLFAIDEYNAWMQEVYTQFVDFQGKPVHRSRSTLINHFLSIAAPHLVDSDSLGVPTAALTPRHGAVVVAESTNHGAVQLARPYKGYTTVEYTNYSEKEFNALIDYMQENGYLSHYFTAADRHVLKTVASLNPRKLRSKLSAI